MDNIEIPNLVLTSKNTGYLDMRRCHQACLSPKHSQPTLSAEQQQCVGHCVTKYAQAQALISQKMYGRMSQMVTQDPELRRLMGKAK